MPSPFFAALFLSTILNVGPALKHNVASPDGRIVVTCAPTDAGELTYAVSLNGKPVLEPSPLGFEADCGSWLTGLTSISVTASKPVSDHYHLLHGKRRNCEYNTNRSVLTVRNAQGQVLKVAFQVSNDGVAFRYLLPACKMARKTTIQREATGFHFPDTARAWLMPMEPPGSGWQSVQPCYEAYYQKGIPVSEASPTGAGWAFPALFRVGETAWVLISESDVNGGYCASRLSSPTDDGLYRVQFPNPKENNSMGAAEPSVDIPFASPWRVIMLGDSLKPIVESTLVTDVASPAKLKNTEYIKPGKAVWSWLREKNDATVFDRQKTYVDLAAKLGFEYCLVDAMWDTQIGYDKTAELAKYANKHGVGILLWYNSNGNWNASDLSPKDRMHTHEARMAEFKRLRSMGVKGVKVDFFGGDKQATMQLYMDILKDAAANGILVNCHGATIPRGWHRTWPNLLTIEAVRGYENFTFNQQDTDRAAAHSCMVPFTRNVIGPMDFTPTALGETLDTKQTIRRRTTQAFELASCIVFESGIQHFGLTPDDVAKMPRFVLDFFRALPGGWDDIHFIDGFPGEYVVLARRAGDRWFVAGMNGSDASRDIRCDLSFLGKLRQGILITDGREPQRLTAKKLAVPNGQPLRLKLPPRGGFLFYSEQ